MACCGTALICGTIDGRLIVFVGYRARMEIDQESNPHRSLYKSMQDDAFRTSKTSNDHSGCLLELEVQNEASINCMVAYEAPNTSGESSSSTREEYSTFSRLLTGDSLGLIILWAVLSDELQETTRSRSQAKVPKRQLLVPLLTLSVGKIRNSVGVLGVRRVPPWVSLEVQGVDATPFPLRYDLEKKNPNNKSLYDEEDEDDDDEYDEGGGGRELPKRCRADFKDLENVLNGDTPQAARRLLKVSPQDVEIRSLAHRNGSILVHVLSNELYEISLDVIRAELLSSKSVKACLPRENGIDTALLNQCLGSYHSRVQGNDVLDVGFVKDGMVRNTRTYTHIYIYILMLHAFKNNNKFLIYHIYTR
jgi:hypothetical protein